MDANCHTVSIWNFVFCRLTDFMTNNILQTKFTCRDIFSRSASENTRCAETPWAGKHQASLEECNVVQILLLLLERWGMWRIGPSSQRDKHGVLACGSRLREEAATGNPEEIPCVAQHMLCLIELLLGFINTAGNMLISSYWGQKKIERSYFDFLSSLNKINGFKSFSKLWAVKILFPYLNSISCDFVSCDAFLKYGTTCFNVFFFFCFPAGLQWEGRIVSGV